MSQIPLHSRAIILPLGNKLGFSGTLSNCLSHWQDNLTASERVTSVLALDTSLEGRVYLEPWEVQTLARTVAMEQGKLPIAANAV